MANPEPAAIPLFPHYIMRPFHLCYNMANLMISSTERRPFINREERVRAALAVKEADRVLVAA